MSNTPDPADPETPTWFRPWRSATLGWFVALAVLAAGVPLFVCMPPWNDVTLHDMAVRSMLRGGVHYRDVFDTNLPGIDWAMAGVRAVFGWRYEVLRVADLVVIGAEVALLLMWVSRAGGTGYSVAWLAAAAAMFYPFTSEFNHVQRDPWLLLPALVAMRMRLGRVEQSGENVSPLGSVFEGLMWGLAVWIKPHVIVPAAAVWLVSAVLIARREIWRGVFQDLFWLLVGGVIAGAAGVAWLVATGAWPHFLDVFLNWNPDYLSDVWPLAGRRLAYTTYCFRQWSLLHVVALPLAVLAFWEARLWSRRSGDPARLPLQLYAPAETESAANHRAMLAALYLGWFAQTVLLQKGFEYTQVPLLLLAMAVVASHRWAFGFLFLLWFAVMGLVVNASFLGDPVRELNRKLDDAKINAVRVEGHPLTNPEVVSLWRRCVREGGTPELRNRLAQYTDIHCGTNWEDLEQVAEYLRTLDPPLGPGELNCWHDTTHPLYLTLDLEPATRYMHYGTVMAIRKKTSQIADEVRASKQRYVVSDLLRMTWHKSEAYAPGAGDDPLALPQWFPVSQRDKFPWNQPVVFRAGRYVVHKVEKPLGEIDIPAWESLDKLGPGR